MVSIQDIQVNELISKTAQSLKETENIKAPEWSKFVKTGAHKERPPEQKDWWYLRAAAILRKINNNGPIGVNKLRTCFGGKKNRGYKPERTYKAGGKIIRTIIQQLEKEGLIKQDEKDTYKGRIITPKGKSFLTKQVKLKK